MQGKCGPCHSRSAEEGNERNSLLFPDQTEEEDSALATSADQRSAEFDSSDRSGKLWRGFVHNGLLQKRITSEDSASARLNLLACAVQMARIPDNISRVTVWQER